jgi:hypothetical protein
MTTQNVNYDSYITVFYFKENFTGNNYVAQHVRGKMFWFVSECLILLASHLLTITLLFRDRFLFPHINIF